MENNGGAYRPAAYSDFICYELVTKPRRHPTNAKLQIKLHYVTTNIV